MMAVAGLLLTVSPIATAQNWTLTGAPKTNWSAIAVSADGSKIVAAASGGLIYRSTDAGTNWFPTSAPSNAWASVASSADGSRLIAAASGDRIFISTNAGSSWSPCPPVTNSWTSVATSADGNRLIAVAYSGAILTSGDAGGNWTSNVVIAWDNVVKPWNCVASSADGTKQFASDDSLENRVFTTTNSGLSWLAQQTPGLWLSVRSIAVSSDGQHLVAGARTGSQNHCSWLIPLVGSTNGGNSWDTYPSPLEVYWCTGWPAVASSSDGLRLAAVTWDGAVFMTTNRGINWVSNRITSSSPTQISAAAAADANRLFVAISSYSSSENGIYAWHAAPLPTLNITPTGDSLRISWVVPSMPFVLQETTDLNTPDWTAVPMTPILNLTNLHHEVTVPLSGTNRFYRLQHSE